MVVLCLECLFRVSPWRCDIFSTPPLGLTMILSCLVDSKGSGRYLAGCLTHPDWSGTRQQQQGSGDTARLSYSSPHIYHSTCTFLWVSHFQSLIPSGYSFLCLRVPFFSPRCLSLPYTPSPIHPQPHTQT